MSAHGAERDRHLLRDLFVAEAAPDELDDLFFARGQTRTRRLWMKCRVSIVILRQAIQQQGCTNRLDYGAAMGDYVE